MPRVLPATDRVASPWKNGGGVTREIAAWPPEAGLEQFDWRVSMATVEQAGPFSHFPGVDRHLTVLQGELELTVDGATARLGPTAPPLSFPGDAPAFAHPLRGAVTDLNVMTRRARVLALVELWLVDGQALLDVQGPTLLLNGGPELRLDGTARLGPLGPDDAVLWQASEGGVWRLQGHGPAYVVRFFPVTSGGLGPLAAHFR